MAMLTFKTQKDNGQKFVHEYPNHIDFINAEFDSDIMEEDDIIIEASVDGKPIDLYEYVIDTVKDLQSQLCCLLTDLF